MCKEAQGSGCPGCVGTTQNIFSEDFCLALDSSSQPVYIIDPKTYEVLYCNEVVRALSGCNPVGEPCYKGVRGLDHFCSDCLAVKLCRDGVIETQEYCTPQGNWIMARLSLFRWRGQEFYKLTCFDITQRKQLEAQVRLRNKEYSALLQQSMTGILRYEIASDTAEVNVDRNLDRVKEYTIPYYSNVVCNSGLVARGSVPAAKQLLQDVRSGRPSGEYDIQLQMPQGDRRWMRVRYVLIDDDEGQPDRAMVSFYDNTQQKEKELAYQSWSARLDSLLNDHTVYMEVDLTSDLVEMESRPKGEPFRYKGRPYTFVVDRTLREVIFEKDRSIFRTFFNRTRLLGQFFAGEQECVLEYRVTAMGKLWWYRAEVRLVRDPVSDHVKASILLKDMDEEFRERDRLKEEAERDSMTGLYNHATTERLIQKVLDRNTGEQCCFLVVDLDDLRAINSDLGHPEGDRALKAIAECLTQEFGDDDILGRTGGDEFVAFLRNVPGETQLRSWVFSFIDRLRTVKIGPQRDRPVHVSVGGSLGIAGFDEFDTLYRQADLALYYTKAMGKNGFHLYRPALEKREFSYQPRSKVSMNRNDWSEAAELKRLLNAVSVYFPLVISANISKNSFYMLEYENFTTQRAGEHGSYDQLILDGASSFHPQDRQSFVDCFGRENLLRSYEAGQHMVEHRGRQLGDDGTYRMAHTIGVMSKDPVTGDICEVSFTHMTPP